MVKKYSIIILFCFLSHLTYAQVKIEKESRVVSNDVPEIAIKWLEDVFDHKKKLKWYFEISADSHSYEAKFIRKGKKFSVEFSEEGIIEDIEIFEHWRKLPQHVKDNISDYLEGKYIKSRIEKIQVQYTGTKEDFQNWVKTNYLNQIVIKYELEFYGETSNSKKIWEGLFDNNGQIQMSREIILTPSNNLFY
tara:strand:+ start:6911 stop:7486 length:576 start_codon:yes stop_codon:yes gene_type:complete